MIQIEKTETYGWKAAIRGMRNPMNSWEQSDSKVCAEHKDCMECTYWGNCASYPCDEMNGNIIPGPSDFALMKKLAAAGPDHGKFLRMIVVYTDITAPLYWWKEFDTYKVGTVANSCSTMHKIQAKEFTLDDFSCEHLIGRVDDGLIMANSPLACLRQTIAMLNDFRETFLTSQDKVDWWQMIQLLPTSYNQKRTVLLNYAVLKNIYHARKNHKLDEWRDFCGWTESLPYSELITE